MKVHFGAGKSGAAQVDHQWFGRRRKPERDRVGAQCRARTARRRHQTGRADGVQADQVGTRDLLDVIGAAPAHPAIGHPDQRKAVAGGLGDRQRGRVLHGQHAGVIAAIEQGRHRRLMQCANRRARLPPLRAGGDLQNLRHS